MGLANKGEGGRFLESVYRTLMTSSEKEGGEGWMSLDDLEEQWTHKKHDQFGEKERVEKRGGGRGKLDPKYFPVNTHGGLLGYGAPWEVPAIYSVIEAFTQLRGRARDRQIENCRRALVYGNGGIFSHSAIAILEKVI